MRTAFFNSKWLCIPLRNRNITWFITGCNAVKWTNVELVANVLAVTVADTELKDVFMSSVYW